MTSDHTSELFPVLADDAREFEVTMRGYDRRQVDSYLARYEAELAALTDERDSALNRSADLAAQLANSHAQIESLRRRLADTAIAVTPETVHARVRPIVELAQAEARGIRDSVDREATHLRMLADADAAETRRQAALDAERMRGQAQTDLQRATEAGARREQEAEQILSTARAEIAERNDRSRVDAEQLLTGTRSEVESLTRRARADRDRLDTEAAAKRVQANEDFEIALRVRRAHEQKLDDERHDAIVADSERIADAARTESERLVAEGSARVTQLIELRRRVQADLDSVHGRLGQVLEHIHELAESHSLDDAGPAEPSSATGPLPHVDAAPDAAAPARPDTAAPPGPDVAALPGPAAAALPESEGANDSAASRPVRAASG